MASRLIIHRAGSEPEKVILASLLSAGGGEEDAIRIPGAPPSALLCHPDPAGLVAEARVEAVRAAGRPLAPRARRLVLAGERVEVEGCTIEVECGAPPEGTRLLAGALLKLAAAGREPPAGPHLLVLTGSQAGRRIPLEVEQTIGRGRSASIRLADDQASRVHARLRVSDGEFSLDDLGSKNGILVNGAKLGMGPFPLRPGDEITIGATFLRLCSGPADPEPAASGPAPGAAGEQSDVADAGHPADGAGKGPRLLGLFCAALLLAACALALVLAGA